jgi:hypothetical protein
MKTSRWICVCVLFLLCIGFAGLTTDALGQEKRDLEKYMPILRGVQWQQMNPDAKVAFIWGAAHVILIELVLMEEIPELRKEGFATKVREARDEKARTGTVMKINEVISAIDQYYKNHPDQLQVPVMKVIWDVGIKPYLKTGIAGRPLK